jgi:hypothetical protein
MMTIIIMIIIIMFLYEVGGTYTVDVWEMGAEENIRTEEG